MAQDGAAVWVPDKEELWVRGDVVSISGAEATVKLEGGETKTVNVEKELKAIGTNFDKANPTLPLQNSGIPEGGIENMANLDYLHEPAVLNNLSLRHKCGSPYTYTGSTTIACNPYAWLKIYNEELRRKFLVKSRSELMPHVYSSSAKAYMEMHMHHINQSILVSGESGAGKTETVKILMRHLAAVSNDMAKNAAAAEFDGVEEEEVELKNKEEQQDTTIRKILQSNPLLEGFGNAKTSRNDNSSRFGKFVQLQFDFRGVLIGAHTNTYLLEKSRVVWQAKEERNYHIFHQLLGASKQERDMLKLTLAPDKYNYVPASNEKIEGLTDGEHFKNTKEALKTLGVPMAEQALLYRLLSGLMNLGQVTFAAPGGDTERSEVKTVDQLAVGASLIGLEPDMLSLTLTSRQLVTRGGQSVTRVPLNVKDATGALDATAKGLYVRVFDWLVGKINDSAAAAADSDIHHIDLLDIFGFESFEHNSFEQLCINYANESLQQKFCQDVFKSVQDEYTSEGIPLSSIAFADNKNVLDMLESRMGVLSILNEECVRPGGSDPSFASKALNAWVKPGSPMLRERKNDIMFKIVHYADTVCYDATGWCEKNKDALHEDMVKQLQKSTSAFIRGIFPVETKKKEDDGGKGGPRRGGSRRGSSMASSTVSTQFKSQLKSLMKSIGETSVQYVRCVKPNKNKSPTEFDKAMVIEQLRSAGVVEAIEMSRAAYPNRMLAEEFLTRFYVLSPTHGKLGSTELMGELSRKYPIDGVDAGKAYAFGKTKIFFVKGVLEALEDARLEYFGNAVVTVQRMLRGHMARKNFKFYMKSKDAIVKLQAWVRCRCREKQHWRRKKTAIRLQAQYRGKKGRKRVMELRRKRVMEAAAEEAKLRMQQMAAKREKDQKKAAAEAAAKAAKDKIARAAADKLAVEAKEAEEAEAEAAAQADKVKAEQEKAQKAEQDAVAKEEQAKKDADVAAKTALESSLAKAKIESEKEVLPSMEAGLEYSVTFDEGPLGIWFTGDTVTELQQNGQGQKLGVIEGSSVLSIAGQALKSVWEVSSMVTSAERPLTIDFKKPGLRNVRHRRQSVDFRELEYDVEFDDGPLGIELDIKLSVKCLAPGGQAQKGGVRVGSNMVAVGGVPVSNIQELATAMKSAQKPVTIRFRRKRRKKRKYSQQPAAVKAEMEKKEKEYLEWLYGRCGTNDTSTVFRQQMDKSNV